MTPELRELLKRHPAPWSYENSGCDDCVLILDANEDWIVEMDIGDQGGECGRDPARLPAIFVELVNDYAARVAAGEGIVSGGSDG